MKDPAPGELRHQLRQGLLALELPADGGCAERLLRYLALLEKWNRVYNLTGVRDMPTMVTSHLLDSLSVHPFITGRYLLDVGSGAGLPGLPLAVAMPDLRVTLLESRQKRARFLEYVVSTLGLANVDVVCRRVEQYQPQQKFDTLVTRAFSTIAAFTDLAGHLCAKGGKLIALKGRCPEAELADVDQKRFKVTEVCPVSVPGLNASRHVVVLTPS